MKTVQHNTHTHRPCPWTLLSPFSLDLAISICIQGAKENTFQPAGIRVFVLSIHEALLRDVALTIRQDREGLHDQMASMPGECSIN